MALQNQRRPGREWARPPSKGRKRGQLEVDCGADCHTGQVTSPHLTIGRAASDDELTEFLLFANEVYAERPAHWVTTPGDLVPLLKGEDHPGRPETFRWWRGQAGGSSPEPLRL